MTQEDRDKVERRVAEALSKAAPLRICASMKEAMDAYGQGELDKARKERFETYQRSLSAVGPDGLLELGSCFREASGRIHPRSGAIGIANAIRSHVAPSGPHRVFVDADYSNAHMRIAAVRSKDTALLAAFDAGTDCYDALGVAVLPAVEDRKAVRKVMKRAALSLINGAKEDKIAEYLKGLSNDPAKDARALIAHWNTTFPDLAAYIGGQIEAVKAAGGSSFEVETLTGRKVRIDHNGNPRTVLSALWLVVEAEALDLALSRLSKEIEPSQGRLVLPMYDGLLLDAPRSKARAVVEAVKDLMIRAMAKAGVPGVAVKVEARERWGPRWDGDAIDLKQDGPDVQQAKDFTEPDDLPWLTPDAAWLNEAPPVREYLLHDFDGHALGNRGPGLYARGKVGMLAAGGGVGKTYALCGLALAIVSRLPWLGHFPVGTSTIGRVVLILGEEDPDEIRRRIHTQAHVMGVTDPAVLANILVLPGAGMSTLALTQSEDHGKPAKTLFADALLKTLDRKAEEAGKGWDAVILDPLSRFAGPDVETDNAAATRLIQVLESFTKLKGAPAVMVAHHTTKGSRREGSDGGDATSIRGSSALVDGARWTANMESIVRVDEQCPDFAKVTITKSNYAAFPKSCKNGLMLVRVPGSGGLRVANKEETEAFKASADKDKAEKAKKKSERAAENTSKKAQARPENTDA